MSTTARYFIKIVSEGDINYSEVFEGQVNTQSSMAISLFNLTPPTANINFLSNDRGVLLLPPVGNTTAISIKATTDTTGIEINPDSPTFIARSTNQNTIQLAVASTIQNMRFIRI